MYGREVAISAIESGVADALLVRALDRATRDQEDAAKLFKRAERNAWRLMDCDKADSGDPSQRLLADIRIAVPPRSVARSASAPRRGCEGHGSGGSDWAGHARWNLLWRSASWTCACGKA
jgi:DNA invertase Pin-like site-specific DNA recombinase